METEFDPHFIEFLFTFILLIWIHSSIHPAQDIRLLLYIIKFVIIKVRNLIGKSLITVGELLRLTGNLLSSADAPIKIDIGDQCFLNLTLGDVNLLISKLQSLAEEEEEMCSEWRHITEEAKTLLIQHEAWCRSNFNYVILCPFLSDNAPRKRFRISTQEAWCIFVRSIIYVGKGTRSSRPYEHIYKAADLYNEQVNGLPHRNYRNYRNIR